MQVRVRFGNASLLCPCTAGTDAADFLRDVSRLCGCDPGRTEVYCERDSGEAVLSCSGALWPQLEALGWPELHVRHKRRESGRWWVIVLLLVVFLVALLK